MTDVKRTSESTESRHLLFSPTAVSVPDDAPLIGGTMRHGDGMTKDDDLITRQEHVEVIRLIAAERNEALAEVERLREAMRQASQACRLSRPGEARRILTDALLHNE